MKILWNERDSCLRFGKSGEKEGSEIFVDKSGRRAKCIKLDNVKVEMTICHELSHLFLCKRFHQEEYDRNGIETLREEMMSWRLAKSFCKYKFWDEEYAKECVIDYVRSCRRWIHIDTLKIVELNKGVKLNDFTK